MSFVQQAGRPSGPFRTNERGSSDISRSIKHKNAEKALWFAMRSGQITSEHLRNEKRQRKGLSILPLFAFPNSSAMLSKALIALGRSNSLSLMMSCRIPASSAST